MKPAYIAIIILALIVGAITLGYFMSHYKPYITENKTEIAIVIPKAKEGRSTRFSML